MMNDMNYDEAMSVLEEDKEARAMPVKEAKDMTILEALLWLKKNMDTDQWIDLEQNVTGEYGPTRIGMLAHIFLKHQDEAASSVPMSWNSWSHGELIESDLVGLVAYVKRRMIDDE